MRRYWIRLRLTNIIFFRHRRSRNKIECRLIFLFRVAILQCIIIIICYNISAPDYLKLRKPLTIQKSSSNALPVTKVFSYMRAGGRSGIFFHPSPAGRQYGRLRENRDAKLLLSDKKKKNNK